MNLSFRKKSGGILRSVPERPETRRSDFLLAALALRTMIEDLSVHAQLDAWEWQIREHEIGLQKVDASACSLIRSYAELLQARLLPYLPGETAERRGQGPHAERILLEHYGALKDYVHPNYGSHVAAILPEESAVGSLFLAAFGAIYSRFLGIGWVASAPRVPTGQAELLAEPPSADEFEIFLGTTLPALREALNKYGQKYGQKDLGDGLPVESLYEWSAVYRENVRQVEGDVLANSDLTDKTTGCLRPLCDLLEPAAAPHSPEAIVSFPHRQPQYGFDPEDWIVHFGGARRIADKLTRSVKGVNQEGLFPAAAPYDRWIDLIRRSIELTLTVTQLKENSARRAAIRMINQRNLLGAVLAARSLMEHHASAFWVTSRLRRQWEKVENRARSAQDVKPELNELERLLARFLAGTKGTKEAAMVWRSRWADHVTAISLDTVVSEAFPSEIDDRKTSYDRFCRIVHGGALRGGDLLEPRSQPLICMRLGQVVSVINSLTGLETTCSEIVPAVYVLGRMTRHGGPGEQLTESGLLRAISHGQLPRILRHGTDYFGAGTESDPFRFKRSLDQDAAIHAWCKQEGHEPLEIELGSGETVVHTAGGTGTGLQPCPYRVGLLRT